MLRELGQHRGVIARLDHHGDVVVVLRRGADHGRAADVDVLDAVGKIGAARDGGFERVEIDHQQIDRPDVVRAHRLGVRGVVAHRQQAAMDRRMQRLDPAVHHLGKSGEIADVEHVEPGIAQGLARAAGRNQLDAVAGQRAGEVDDAGFVGDGNEGARYAAELLGHRLSLLPPARAGEAKMQIVHNGSRGSSSRRRRPVPAVASAADVVCWKVHSTRGVAPAWPRMTSCEVRRGPVPAR